MGRTSRQAARSGVAGRWRLAVIAAFGAGALVAGGYPREARAIDGTQQSPVTGHWYKYVDVPVPADWNACRSEAVSLGGYLATIGTAEEHDWVLANLGIAGKPACWLGGTDSVNESNWEWIDGSGWTFDNWDWGSGEPSDLDGSENWLAMSPAGTWSDEPVTTQLYGYVIEWNTDPNLIGPGSGPRAPTNLAVNYVPGAGAILTWADNSDDEGGFRIERMPQGQDWSARAATNADVTTWTDFSLYPSTTISYRVAAYNGAGESEWSNEVAITTSAGESLPPLPGAPSGLAAVAVATPSIDVSWTDNSVDETRFDLERAAGGAAFADAASLLPGTTTFRDEAVHPGWPYTYRIRALSLQGPSSYSGTVTATVPATLDVSFVAGKLTRSSKPGRDTVKLAASCAFPPLAAGSTLDPVGNGLELQVGPAGAPLAVSIPAHAPGWSLKTRKGKPVQATWKSARGVSPKVAVVVDLVKGAVSVTASGASFAADPSAVIRVLVACGAGCGADSATWTARKPGLLQFK